MELKQIEEIKNMNKRIKSIIATVTVLVAGAFSLNYLHAEEVKAFDQCSGTYKTYTSEMKKPVKVKESKLTSLRYLKKISTLVSEEPIVVRKTGKVNTVYTFKSEGIEGYLQVKNKKERLAVFKINGKLYGRITWKSGQIYLKMNLHDSMAKQQIYVSSSHQYKRGCVTYERYYTSKFTEYGLGKRSREMKDAMLRYAKTNGLY